MSEKTDKILTELGYEPTKRKTPQPQTVNEVQGRDLFQTPNYAVDLLVPFIPRDRVHTVWEPACGDGKIVRRLLEVSDFDVYASDIRKSLTFNHDRVNFLTEDLPFDIVFEKNSNGVAIVTNPPFSLKQKFYNRCREYNIPFALLVSAEYSIWTIQACIDGAEKIVPTRRIDYITPNILTRIHEGEVYNYFRARDYKVSLKEYKHRHPDAWRIALEKFDDLHNYKTIEEVPIDLLAKYSSSDFHSLWLTWGFGLGKTETFVDLTNEQRKENI